MTATTRGSLFWPALLALLAFAVLIGLGTWQVQRLHWKEGLIARIEARTQAEPVPLDAALARWNETGEVEYLHVRLRGRFLHQDEIYVYTISKEGQPGWRVVTPFETEDGRIVMVDRGFVPLALKEPSTRAAGQIEGVVQVAGLARAPESQGLFTPDNNVEDNTWYWRDLAGMAKATLDDQELPRLAPFFVELDAGSVPGGWPRGGATRLTLPNRHLEYALTWYGLAAALAAVCLFALLKRRREGSHGESEA